MAGLRLLAVDDSPINLKILTTALGQVGHQVVATARTGAGALVAYRQTQPDIVAMDIVMPDMDGIEATKQILAEFPKAVIVMVTTVGRETMVAKALAAGANGYIRHPLDHIELAEVLNNSRRYRARMDRGNLVWD